MCGTTASEKPWAAVRDTGRKGVSFMSVHTLRNLPPQKPDVDIDQLIANARQASEFLKALSHEARLVILCLLLDGEKSVTEIDQTLDLRQPAVSQQLARLRADDLVETRRDGKSIYYSLARPEVREVITALHRAFCKPERR